ncbi:spindle assembly abnormal protein 6 homolog isoform X2 [Maniola jurtina]|uniref:spindle assembly abnormal protein 6 homolog isoform X2 n=1 Tax=Maniola jurtina TaxID=191418 RepID=UPI001E689292|nr:spindle assembly abnormal protein 6 homolog isoform X2 [Maniola jurtina]
MVYKTFHKGKYFITFKRGFEDSKKDLTLTVDKLFENDSLRITLADDEDPTFLCRINLTRCDYEDLKKQQGLLIDFDSFPSQVVRLLQQCASNNMFLIVHQISPIQYNFEVVEHNEFRRIIHLSLKTGPACDSDVKQHMAETIGELKEKLQLQRSAEINSNNLLAMSQENLSKKDKEIEELMHNNKQLRDNITQLEYQISDKAQRTNLLEKEVQKTHIEVATLKAKNATLERDISEKEMQINQLNSKCAYLEKAMKDSSDNIKELNDNIQTLKMEKTSLERRLTLSESLANKNSEAAHSTTEQLLKANQIISKQSNELIEMKEKLLCRTAIALEQEKVIDRNTKEIEDLKSEINITKDCMEKLRSELEVLKEKYESNEQALRDRDETIKNNNMVIQWLHKKMDENAAASDYNVQNKCRTALQSATSSTPYLVGKNVQNDSSQDTDETINFYATSKLSSIEESPQLSIPSKNGLDPKYLQPASDDNQARRKEMLRSSSTNTQSKGKENKVADLPKVDYREKKSSRPSTYRATPVSAYFP